MWRRLKLRVWISLWVAIAGIGVHRLHPVPPPVLAQAPVLIAAQPQSLQRVALVIGNSNYQKTGKLLNPTHDADDIATALNTLGFEVILLKDADLLQMNQALDQFSQKLQDSGVGLFFFAGHGIQLDGENYLIPVDAQLRVDQDLAYEALPVGKVLNLMEAADNNTNILILDACRNNPFKRSWISSSRSVTGEGLAALQAVEGSYIAYATAPGKVAWDGQGRNGVFTAHLLKHIQTPNLSVERLFKLVRQGVSSETNRRQIPWDSSSLVGDFSFNARQSAGQPPSPPLATPAPAPPAQPRPAVQPTLVSLRTLNAQGLISGVRWNPNGNMLASAGREGVLKLWQADGSPLAEIEAEQGWIGSLSWSPDGETLATGGKDSSLKLWKRNGKLITTINTNQGWVSSIDWSPDGQTLATGGKDSTLKLWQRNGSLVTTLNTGQGEVYSLSWSADGQTLATGGFQGSVKLWNRDGTLITAIKTQQGWIGNLAWHPDQKLLATGGYDGSVKLWKQNGSLVHTIRGQQRQIKALSWTSDGQILATGKSDLIKVWSRDGLPITEINADQGGVESLSWHPNRPILASAGNDGSVKLWQLDER